MLAKIDNEDDKSNNRDENNKRKQTMRTTERFEMVAFASFKMMSAATTGVPRFRCVSCNSPLPKESLNAAFGIVTHEKKAHHHPPHNAPAIAGYNGLV